MITRLVLALVVFAACDREGGKSPPDTPPVDPCTTVETPRQGQPCTLGEGAQCCGRIPCMQGGDSLEPCRCQDGFWFCGFDCLDPPTQSCQPVGTDEP